MEPHHYIYLLQEREFIKSGESIYKIGRTQKEHLIRFAQYPKGSSLLFQMRCRDGVRIEAWLLKIFKDAFIQRLDIGKEYFEGRSSMMMELIYQTIKLDNRPCNKVDDTIDDNTSDDEDTIEDNTIDDTTIENVIMPTVHSEFSQLSTDDKYKVVSLTIHLSQFQHEFNIPLFETNLVDDIKYYHQIMHTDNDVIRIVISGIYLLYYDNLNLYKMVSNATKRVELYNTLHEQESFSLTTLKFFQIIVLINTIKQCLSNVPSDAISIAFLNKLHDIKPSLSASDFKLCLNLPPIQEVDAYNTFVNDTYGWDNANINSLVREFSNEEICAIHTAFVELERSYST